MTHEAGPTMTFGPLHLRNVREERESSETLSRGRTGQV